MSYFDHVRCHHCRASLDPEQIGKQGMTCPKCGTHLTLTDLFGVKASFAEDDLPDLGLDDVVGRVAQPGADWKPPPAPPKRAPGTPPPGVTPPKAAGQAGPGAPRATGGVGSPVASRKIPLPTRPQSPEEAAAAREPARPAAPAGGQRTAPPVRSIGLNGSAAPPKPAARAEEPAKPARRPSAAELARAPLPRAEPTGAPPAATGRMAPPKAEDGALVRVAKPEEDPPPPEARSSPARRVPGQTSAADLMKALKGKK